MNRDKLLQKIRSGTADTNIPFRATCNLLKHLGFNERIRGSHHIFTYLGIPKLLDLQPQAGKVKPYQVKQIRTYLRCHSIGG